MEQKITHKWEQYVGKFLGLRLHGNLTIYFDHSYFWPVFLTIPIFDRYSKIYRQIYRRQNISSKYIVNNISSKYIVDDTSSKYIVDDISQKIYR